MESRLPLLCLICIQSCLNSLVSGTASCPFDATSGNIDLGNQGLTSLDASTFTTVYDCSQVFGDVTSLNVSHNSITSVSADSFSSFYELTSLDLSHNNIAALENDTFRSLVALKNLDIGYNALTQLNAGIINLINLEIVVFEHNQISYVEPWIVNDIHENLEYFNLNFNNLTNLDPWPYLIKNRDGYKPVLFDIQHNQIHELTNNVNWTYDLVYRYEVDVNIQFNNLSTIGEELLERYHMNLTDPSLTMSAFLTLSLNVTNNPYFCDCRLYSFAATLRDSILRWSRIEEFRYLCEEPSDIHGIDWLHDLPLDQLVCNVTSGCPASCSCQDRPHNDTFYVDCSNSNLSEMPDLSSLSLNGRSKLEINLDNNTITSLTSAANIDKIYNISLQNNKVTEIGKEFLESATSLNNFDLRNNQIQAMPKEIQRFNYRSVHLSGNPLWCDCDTTWMAEWIKTERGQVDSSSLQCNSDQGVHSLIDMSEDTLNCRDKTTFIYIVIAVAGAFVVLIVLSFVKFCPYDSKVILHAICRAHPWDKYVVDKDVNKNVDIYLVFDEKDPDVVGYVDSKLTKRLSKDKPRYNILNPHKNYFSGNESEAIDEMIRKAKRVLVVLSENIFQNHTRMDEIKNADGNIFEAIAEQRACQDDESQHRDDDITRNAARILYIKYNKSRKLEETLEAEPWRSGLTDAKYRAFLDAANKLFWQKLRYELPPKGSGTEADGTSDVMRTGRTGNNNNTNNNNNFYTIHPRQPHHPLAENNNQDITIDYSLRHAPLAGNNHNRRFNVNEANVGANCDDLTEIKVESNGVDRRAPNLNGRLFLEKLKSVGPGMRKLSENHPRVQNFGRHLTSQDLNDGQFKV